MKDSLNICLKLNNGKEYILKDISITKDKIKDIKNKISLKKSIRLIYQGKILNNDYLTLKDYSIPYKSLIFIHCILNEIPNLIQEDKILKNKKLGFNILLESGYIEEEIRDIRLRFHKMNSNLNYIDGIPPTEFDLNLEEEWINQSGRRIPKLSENIYKEILSGLILGFFLGVLCLFWLKESVFTKSHQLGILMGIIVNLYFGYNYFYH